MRKAHLYSRADVAARCPGVARAAEGAREEVPQEGHNCEGTLACNEAHIPSARCPTLPASSTSSTGVHPPGEAPMPWPERRVPRVPPRPAHQLRVGPRSRRKCSRRQGGALLGQPTCLWAGALGPQQHYGPCALGNPEVGQLRPGDSAGIAAIPITRSGGAGAAGAGSRVRRLHASGKLPRCHD